MSKNNTYSTYNVLAKPIWAPWRPWKYLTVGPNRYTDVGYRAPAFTASELLILNKLKPWVRMRYEPIYTIDSERFGSRAIAEDIVYGKYRR